jgi:hypothetical protein
LRLVKDFENESVRQARITRRHLAPDGDEARFVDVGPFADAVEMVGVEDAIEPGVQNPTDDFVEPLHEGPRERKGRLRLQMPGKFHGQPDMIEPGATDGVDVATLDHIAPFAFPGRLERIADGDAASERHNGTRRQGGDAAEHLGAGVGQTRRGCARSSQRGKNVTSGDHRFSLHGACADPAGPRWPASCTRRANSPLAPSSSANAQDERRDRALTLLRHGRKRRGASNQGFVVWIVER